MKRIFILLLFLLLLSGCSSDKKQFFIGTHEKQLSETKITIENNNTDSCVDLKEIIKPNPKFLDVAQAGCGENNRYIGKQVQWEARVSNYAHTTGIRFWVIDEDHLDSDIERNKHGLFWGTFLASPLVDPRFAGQEQEWAEKWDMSWIKYIMDVYGHIDYEKVRGSKFLVTVVIGYVDCGVPYDGCYIETTVKKIKKVDSL